MNVRTKVKLAIVQQIFLFGDLPIFTYSTGGIATHILGTKINELKSY